MYTVINEAEINTVTLLYFYKTISEMNCSFSDMTIAFSAL